MLMYNVNLYLPRPHAYFMAPNLIVERHRRDVRIRKRIKTNTNCHYHGRVRGQEQESRVALSACHGLVSKNKLNALVNLHLFL